MKLAAMIAAFAVLMLFDLPALIRSRKWRELAVYSLITAAAGVYLICYVLEKEPVSFIRMLAEFTKNTLKLDYELWQGHK